MKCKNCESVTEKIFCVQCGLAVEVKRIDSNYVSHEIQHLLHFEKGFFYTAKELLIRPGSAVKKYLGEDRSKHFKPIIFLFFASLIYTLVANSFHIDARYIKVSDGSASQIAASKSSVMSIVAWVQGNFGYANILMGLFIAFWIKCFYRRYSFNFFEITVLVFFVMGESMLFLTVGAVITGLTKLDIFYKVMATVFFLYSTWAVGQFFDKNSVSS